MIERLIFLFFIIYFQCVFSVKINQNSIAKNELLAKLKAFIESEKSQMLNSHVVSHPVFGKSVLVKRIIPHNYESGAYEYDSKLNTLYKPLVRFHMKKPIKKHEKYLLKKRKNRNVIGYVVVVGKERKLKNELKEKIKKLLVKDEDSIEGMNLGLYLRKKAGGSHAKEISELFGKSHEEVDSAEPGRIPYIDSSLEVEGPKITIPEYPFWNYWTYSKTIHQDRCKAGLVRVGNVCLAPSVHRRYRL